MDITSIGTKIVIQSAVSPTGYTLTQAPQDGTFWTVDETEFADVLVGMNCDDITYSKPSVITLRISVPPNSRDDNMLASIAAYNRPQGVSVNLDVIQIYKLEPSEKKSLYANFKMTSAPLDNTAEAEGKYSTKTYTFKGVQKVM